MGALSIVWYFGLMLISEDILGDSIAALGLMIAFYYGLTGFACAWFYRRELTTSVKSFLAVGVMPFLGGATLTYVLIKSISDLSEPGKRDVLGIGPPLAIAIFFAILGVVVMILQRIAEPQFFQRKPQVAEPGSLAPKAEAAS